MSTISTQTVAVNAAFLQEIKADNQAFHSLLDALHRLANQPILPEDQVGSFARLLADLRDQLALHFSLEEAYGYFEDAVDQAPQLCLRAEALRSEHAELFVELCSMVEMVEQATYDATPAEQWFSRAGAEFQSFKDRLMKHEHSENDLILCAFDDDIGVGD